MSWVTGITLIINANNGNDILNDLNKFLYDSETKGEFKELSNSYGGTKHPQHYTFAGGFNHFPEEKFVKWIQDTKWDTCYDDHWILILRKEEGQIVVIRNK